jgi:uncharacterized protein YjbI with pentapeptide repeats
LTWIPQWTGFAKKTLWDWLELLVIPLALAAIAFGLNYFANERDQRREDRRAALERALAADSRREDALRVYLQQMSSLMLDRGLRTSLKGSQVRAVGRAFTLTALRRLDPRRKAAVVGFLAEAGLIGSLSQRSRAPLPAKVDLSGADLRNVPLRNALLDGVNFTGVDLRGADFRDAFLSGASFDNANLRDADFRHALMAYPFRIARPSDWNPAGRTTFMEACVAGARFAVADMKGVIFAAAGWNVDLSNADLEAADFRGADITQAKFDGATTKRAVFPYEWTPTGLRNNSRYAIGRCSSWSPIP